MSEQELKAQILKLVEEKIKSNELPNPIRVIELNSSGEQSSVTKNIRDPNLYFTYLFDRKKLIKGDIFSNLAILKSILKEDLKVSEQTNQQVPETLQDVKIASITKGMDGFSLKAKVLAVDVFEGISQKNSEAYSVYKLILGDETGTLEMDSIYKNEQTKNLTDAIEGKNLVGKVIYAVNLFTAEPTKYSMLPVVVRLRKNGSIEIDEESHINEIIQYTNIGDINRETKVASIQGKIIGKRDARSFEYSRGSNKGKNGKIQDFDVINVEGKTISIKAWNEAVDAIPIIGSFVEVIFATASLDSYRVEKNYEQPVILTINKSFQIKTINVESPESYPSTRSITAQKVMLSEIESGKKVELIAYIKNLQSKSWNAEKNMFVDRNPFYFSCMKTHENRECRKKAVQIEGVWTCTRHGAIEETEKKRRWLINAEITDLSNTLPITIYDEMIEKIFGITPERLLEDYDSMLKTNDDGTINHSEFFNLYNNQLIMDGLVFKIVGFYEIDNFEKFNVKSIEPIVYNEAYTQELSKLLSD